MGQNTRPLTQNVVPQATIDDLVHQVMDAMGPRANPQGNPQNQMPVQNLPIEEVELVGEKVKYKIALDPEIFYRHSIFKAQVERLGNKRGLPAMRAHLSLAAAKLVRLIFMARLIIYME
ncbi:hypothetical protein MUP77_05320 [Candidatus Bathyarchaeota archaeon]|nr:hypothetical protein [Candidatus Bathyarchaeota archaeon]